MDLFLNILDEKLPLCKNELNDVPTMHEKRFKSQRRTVESIRQTIATMHCKKLTEGPLTPDDVERSKHTRYKMSARAKLGDGEEMMGDYCFSDNTDFTNETIISNPGVLDDDRRASTPSNTWLPIALASVSHSVPDDAESAVERGPRPLFN